MLLKCHTGATYIIKAIKNINFLITCIYIKPIIFGAKCQQYNGMEEGEMFHFCILYTIPAAYCVLRTHITLNFNRKGVRCIASVYVL